MERASEEESRRMDNYFEITERRKGFATMDELTQGFRVYQNAKTGKLSICGYPVARTFLEGRKIDQMYLVLSATPYREDLSQVEEFEPLTDAEIREYLWWQDVKEERQEIPLPKNLAVKLKVNPATERAKTVAKRLTEAVGIGRRYGFRVDGKDGDYALGITREVEYVPVVVKWRFTENPAGAYFGWQPGNVKLASEFTNLDIVYLAMSATPVREDLSKVTKAQRAQAVSAKFNKVEPILTC